MCRLPIIFYNVTPPPLSLNVYRAKRHGMTAIEQCIMIFYMYLYLPITHIVRKSSNSVHLYTDRRYLYLHHYIILAILEYNILYY